MNKARKHRKSLQILVIPDDKDEPKAYSISIRRLKVLQFLAVLLVLHIVAGAVFYFQYYRVYSKNKELRQVNLQLEDNNKRIYELIAKFEDLESSQTKIRGALGLDYNNGTGNTTVSIQEELSPEVVPSVVPVVREAPTPVMRDMSSTPKTTERFGRLTRTKKIIHDNFVKSVPTYLPVQGVLSNDYEFMNQSGKSSHRGIDIAGERGAPIKAAADGIVIFAGWTYDLGNLAILYHGGGYFTYYGHNQQLLVDRNSVVRKGDSIALLGNSGISSGHHLHFEIWKDGVSLDPKEYLLAFADY